MSQAIPSKMPSSINCSIEDTTNVRNLSILSRQLRDNTGISDSEGNFSLHYTTFSVTDETCPVEHAAGLLVSRTRLPASCSSAILRKQAGGRVLLHP